MCLAVPGRVAKIEGPVGTIDIEGVEATARLDFLNEVQVDDYVLVHAGFAISVIDREEAAETLALMREAGWLVS